jgi:hypothetical protein
MTNPTLAQISENPYTLDSPEFVVPKDIRLVTFEDFSSVPELSVQRISPNFLVRLFRKFDLLYRFLYAFQLLCTSSGKNTVLIVNGASSIFLFIGYLHKLPCFRRTTLLFWYTYLEYRFGTEKRLKFFPFIKFKTAWKESIVACSIAAEEYIVDGETGYVVPSGDAEGLRKRIIELWNDPEKCREMGRKGHEFAAQYLTHEKFMRRFLRFALVLGESKRHIP